jgi:hypothetical protein
MLGANARIYAEARGDTGPRYSRLGDPRWSAWWPSYSRRGDRARFQLFGDTMNTAARIYTEDWYQKQDSHIWGDGRPPY